MSSTLGRWNGKSQDERRAGRREMLIASAIELYGSVGFRNTGVRAVCQDAGLTERYFYESFANSEALLLTTFRHVVAAMRQTIRDADEPTLDPDARIRAMLLAYYGALRANPTGARVFLVEIVGVDPTIDRAFDESLLELSEPMIDVYDAGRCGPLSTDRFLRRAVAGALLHIALAWGRENYEGPIEPVVEAAWTLCRLAIH